MIELLITNAVYVFYRLAISGGVVKFLLRYVNYYWAVIIMAQLSFIYDTAVFGEYFNSSVDIHIAEIVLSNIIYTFRVLVAWFGIKLLWDKINNYWLSVFIGAEITFIFDYFIFKNMFL